MKNHFEETIAPITGEGLYSHDLEVLQVNVGLRCNQSCAHCHVEASPERTEIMDWTTMSLISELAESIQPAVIDLTGGAPELNPHFKKFVETLRKKNHLCQVRTNLTTLLDRKMETLPEFFKEHQVQLVASLPCYLEENVRAQRGAGVYEASMKVIRLLNALGYGTDPSLSLNLVYNPGGAFLPPAQEKLESDYRLELDKRHGIVFTKLLTITNMPLGRFWMQLKKANEDQIYLNLLKNAFNAATLAGLMCRHQISIAWDGMVYDCDFNFALSIPVNHGAPNHIKNFEFSALETRRIVTGDHCFGCTAGCGSSCRGALV
jgi:radical SAM/Cys-rich protein